MKAIETKYNGYRFRSRLEARWAVFFDTAGIKYEYEPEGYYLGDAGWYLPDFYLPDIGGRASGEIAPDGGLWIEVKGVMSDGDWGKISGFVFEKINDEKYGEIEVVKNSMLVVSNIPKDYTECNGYCYGDDRLWNCHTIDGDYYPVQFYKEKDGSIGIYGWDNVDELSGFEALDFAYTKARQARFEHGEHP